MQPPTHLDDKDVLAKLHERQLRQLLMLPLLLHGGQPHVTTHMALLLLPLLLLLLAPCISLVLVLVLVPLLVPLAMWQHM